MELKIRRTHKDARLPRYSTEGAVGMDFFALEDTYISKNNVVKVRTGIAMAIPKGYELQIRMRSGMSLRFPNYIANSPGTIDADYRGEIFIPMSNRLGHNLDIKAGDKIAQGIIAPVKQVTFKEVEVLDDTARGDGGFGSTGG